MDHNRMSFLVFYWKYFIMFLGLKISRKKNSFNKKYIMDQYNDNN